jgi:tetratricopeptide (TPR) repeat protein
VSSPRPPRLRGGFVSFWLAVACGGEVAAQSSFDRGVEAYRRGDYGEARERFAATLREELDDVERARVYYDLGNAHWRLGEALPAVACYSAAVRLDPRHRDAWQNLELARAKENLPPADTGDLGATVDRALSSLRPAERRALLFGALLLWALVLALEVQHGGAALRGALLAASLLLALAVLPWAYGRLKRERAAPVLVIETGNVSLRGEPLEARDPIGELAVLEEVERIDELPGWVRVERSDGTRGWVRAEALYALDLGGDGPTAASR